MKTMRNRVAAVAAFLVLAVCAAAARAAALPAQPQAAKPKATVAEYNAYQAAAAEKNPQQKSKLLDDFMAKYPNSEYLPYVYNDYVQTYSALKQWTKVIEYLDRIAALPEIGAGDRLQAYYSRAATFEYAYNAKSPDLADASTKARDAALQGLKILSTFQKPAQLPDDKWEAVKKTYTTQFYNTAASASFYLKDYKAAAENYHAALALDPQQPVDDYRMGVAELQETPPESTAGFWAVARAVDMKVPDADKVTKYLRDRIAEYQTPGCDSSVDAQVKELLTLAQNAQDPPAGYSIPSATDLNKVREQANIQTVLADLKAGGDKGKLTWLAVCSGEFPEALAKAYDVNTATPDAFVIKAAIGITEEELNASTAASADLKLAAGQPSVARLEKDSIFRFSGKITGYTPDPFYLTWENVKVNPEDIPEEKGKKPAKRPGKAKPRGSGR
jgi:tetratricopeptide (TPR) repeat protein